MIRKKKEKELYEQKFETKEKEKKRVTRLF